MFLMWHSIPDICNMLNASVDVIEDAIRDHLRDWRFKAQQRIQRAVRIGIDATSGREKE